MPPLKLLHLDVELGVASTYSIHPVYQALTAVVIDSFIALGQGAVTLCTFHCQPKRAQSVARILAWGIGGRVCVCYQLAQVTASIR
jgi:hypothetical protein